LGVLRVAAWRVFSATRGRATTANRTAQNRTEQKRIAIIICRGRGNNCSINPSRLAPAKSVACSSIIFAIYVSPIHSDSSSCHCPPESSGFCSGFPLRLWHVDARVRTSN